MAWTTATTRSAGFSMTAAVWNAEVVDNMNFLKRVGLAEVSSDLTITATTEATAQTAAGLGSITYEAVPHRFEFSAGSLDTNANTVRVALFDGSTAVGNLFQGAGSGNADPFGIFMHYLTPTAAAHTYTVKCWTNAGTAVMHAGAGGSDTRLPMRLAVYRVPT